MARLPVHKLPTRARELDLGAATKVYHLPDWHTLSHPEKLAVLRSIAEQRGHDPAIAKLAVRILKRAKAEPREYAKQAAALLAWVQDPKNFYYVNEAGERLQDPIWSIKNGYGDCDDSAILLCSLFTSIGLPWRMVLSGRTQHGQKVRYIEGSGAPPIGCSWAHVYCMVGTPPFNPTEWYYCEPTVRGVPLGWDVVSGDHRYLPEMVRSRRGPPRTVPAPPPPKGFRPKQPRGDASPAYAMAGVPVQARSNRSGVSGIIGGTVAGEFDEMHGGIDWAGIAGAVITGVAVSIATQMTLDYIHGEGLWRGSGTIVERWKRRVRRVELL